MAGWVYLCCFVCFCLIFLTLLNFFLVVVVYILKVIFYNFLSLNSGYVEVIYRMEVLDHRLNCGNMEAFKMILVDCDFILNWKNSEDELYIEIDNLPKKY